MSKSSQYQQKQSVSQKFKQEELELNVDDLLEESDEDDDNLSLDDDEEMLKFKQKTGLSSIASSKMDSSGNKNLKLESNYAQASTQQYNLSTALSQKEEISKLFAQQTQQMTQARGLKETKESLKYSLDDLSSDSDEDIDQFIQQTKNMKPQQTVQALTKGGSYEKRQDSFLSDKGLAKGNNGDFENYNLLSQEQQKQQQPSDILEVIDKNEKMNEVGSDKAMDHASQLLSFDNKFYNFTKKLLDYRDFQDISRKLHEQKNHKYGGMVSAITVVQNYLFVGNSSGIIRVFDLKTQKEMKPLMDENVIGNNKVTSLDISDDGGFLISGYKKGQIALWDLVNYKLIKYIQDLHQSDVVNAKIYHMDESENLYAISAEDSGRVQLIRYNKKSFLGGYSSEAQFLFKTRLKGTATISVLKNSLVAFGSLYEIVVCQMRPVKEIFQVNRPAFCKEKSIPYIDWGYGLTPSQRERTVPIMAFAWDRLIQLVYINERNSTIEMDGFYYSDCEINSLYFMGDSILLALVNGREIKVLYTTKFYPGHFKFLENAKKDDLLNNQFEKVISVTAHAELEKGFEVADIKSNILAQMVMNYNQSVKKQKNNIFFMCGKNIVKGKLFTWREYLDYLKVKESHDLLTPLKVALEIYNGELKGYAQVPDEKEIREGILKGFMKDMVMDSVNQMIYKYANSVTKDGKKQDNYQADEIAIKIAIEFCLSINATYFLFTEIYQIFLDQGLENKFILNMEPFILSGSFRKETIPESIIRKIIAYYEERNNLRTLEKVIQQIDLSEYSQKEELMVTCQVHCLLGALLYLMSQQAEEQMGCMQILNTLLTVVRKAQNIEIGKEDVMNVGKVDSSKKYEIEKSKTYIGYKLLWIIKIFLDGRTFPSGYLSQDKLRMHVYDITNFITNDQFLEELLQFDSEYFFKVIAKLFTGAPLKFLFNQKEYIEKTQIKGFNLCLPVDQIINDLFAKKAQVNQVRMENFYKFIAAVQSQQTIQDNPKINIDYQLVYKAVMSIVCQKETQTIDEEQLIQVIKSKKFKMEDIDRVLSELEVKTSSLAKLIIFLVEKKKDWVQSFKLNLSNNTLRKDIFQWISKTLDKLSSNGKTLQPFNKLKDAIQQSIKELIQINVGECVKLLDKWFEDTYQEQLILDELADYPEVQYDYVKKFLKDNEIKINQAINESTYSNDRRAEAQRYIQYLILHTKLLCKFQPDHVHEFVKKDCYPITECLEICRELNAQRGVAVLLNRKGNFIDSINTYLGIIAEQIEIIDLLKELVSSTKNSSSKQVDSYRWEFLQCQKLKKVHEFDVILRKTLKIADKQEAIIGEDGWFTILEFLSDFKYKAVEKIQQKIKSIDRAKIEKLKDFISQRKNHVLQIVPTSISLQTLTDRLKLDFKQIKQLYDYKVKAVKNNEKYLKLANNLQEKELMSLQFTIFSQIKEGFHLQESQKCCQCDQQISQSYQKLPFQIFYCTHTYHLNCIKDKKCPFCIQQYIGNFRQITQALEIKSKNENRKSKVQKKEESDQNKNKDKSVQDMAKSAFSVSPDRMVKDTHADGLYLKRLEVFDQQNESAGLTKASFQ